ncbi:MAG TPA: hypothetical protein VFN89_01435 [Solirubrobacterales bacterium]|nr:hypothetical protein [Solirubrobacterales bacterium]
MAPRRTGKTTVCDAALDRLRGEGWYAASVDLMHPSGAAGLAQDINRALLGCRPQFRRALAEARNAWERLSDRVRAQALVDLGEGVTIAFGSKPAQVDPEAALEAALSLPQRLAEKDGRPVALFIDELQELAAPAAPFGDPERLQARMRAIFQRSDRVSLLFAGSLEHAMRRVFSPDAPLGGFGGSYALSEITAEEWEDGLSDRFMRAGIEPASGPVARLVELGAGHPRATMLIAAEALVAIREAGETALSDGVVALAWERARAHDAERCRLLVERMRWLRVARGADLALRVARAIAEGEPPYGVGAHAEQVKRVLGDLTDIGVAESRDRGVWRIADPILRAHLRIQPPGTRG